MTGLLTTHQIVAALLLSLASVPLNLLWKFARSAQKSVDEPRADPLFLFVALPVLAILFVILGECAHTSLQAITIENQTDFLGFAVFIRDLFQTASDLLWKTYILVTPLILGTPWKRLRFAKKWLAKGAPFLVSPFVASGAFALLQLEPTLSAHDAWLCISTSVAAPLVSPLILGARAQQFLRNIWWQLIQYRDPKNDTKLLNLLNFYRQSLAQQKAQLLPPPRSLRFSAPPKKSAQRLLQPKIQSKAQSELKPSDTEHDTVLSFLPAWLIK